MQPVPVPSALTASYEGTFERDSLIWTFGKLAERVIQHLFRAPCSGARYARWLLEEVPQLSNDSPEQGLLMLNLELGADGALSVIARPARGEFVVTVRHTAFEVVVASAYGLVSDDQQQDGVCLAHFEGDAPLAARWARALCEWLERRWRTEAELAECSSVAN